uniref:Frizzled-4 n=1 Tax=Panagrellus redivivus TaxID=6233 RepID=A0A7E4ZZM8_PANRE
MSSGMTSNHRSPQKLLVFALLAICISSTAAKPKQCEPITIPLCRGIGYNMTSFPNSYGHERQEEAGLEVHQFYPLVEVGCYKHLKFFLCAMYTPICQENYEMEVMPCREVCLEARKRCAPIMQDHGFKWPVTLACDSLPRAADQATTGQICAAPPDALEEPKPRPTPPMKPHKKKPAMELLYPEIGIDVIDPQCECRCVKPFQVTVNSQHRVHNLTNCAHSCHASALAKPDDKQFMDLWITAWAGVCLCLSTFTVLTFLIEMQRFPYPERPIFFLSLCQAMVAIGFLTRVYYGQETVACDGAILKSGSINIGPCMTIFGLIYYFGMAASAWWVVLSLTWVLAAVPNWSTEWITKYASYFHVFAWVVPAVQTVLAVGFQTVDGDSLSGICYVGNTNVDHLRYFVLGPLLVYFIVGVCFLTVGFLNLFKIRSSLKKTHPAVNHTSKLTQLMSKIGIFSVLYTVPAIFVILVLFYEQHYRPLWEQAQLCPCAAQLRENRDTSTLLSMIKTASMLITGWTNAVWVFSGKTLTSWRRFLCCCCFSAPTHQPLNSHNYQHSHDGIPYMAATDHTGTLSRGNGMLGYPGPAHSNGTSPLSKYQQNADLIFASGNRECLSPLIYGGGTLKHCSAMRGPHPEDV